MKRSWSADEADGNDGNNHAGSINDHSHAAAAAMLLDAVESAERGEPFFVDDQWSNDRMSMVGGLAATPAGFEFLKGFAKGIAMANAADDAASRPQPVTLESQSEEIFLPDPMGTVGCMVVRKLMGLAMGDRQSEIPNPNQFLDVLQQIPQTPPGSPRSLLDVVPCTPPDMPMHGVNLNMPHTPDGTPPVTPEGLPPSPSPTPTPMPGTPPGPPPSTPESPIKTVSPALKRLRAVPRPRSGPLCAGILENLDSAASTLTSKMQ